MKTYRYRRTRIAMYVVLAVCALHAIFPLLYAVSGSFKTLSELESSGSRLIPDNPTLSNFASAWTHANFFQSFTNSAMVTIATTLIGTIAAAMCGYAFARRMVFGSKVFTVMMGAGIFIGAGTATIYPRYVMAQALGINNLVGVVVLQLAEITLLTTFLVRAYCTDMGEEVEEAAMIDGCGTFGAFWHVALPAMRPILTTVAVLTFQWSWNSFQVPLVFTLPRPELQTLTVSVFAIKSAGGDGFGEYSILLAGAVMAVLPIIIVYVIAQRYFMDGLTAGALKG